MTGAPGPDAAGIIHATAVAWQGRAVLIRGASGSGKSALALELMAWGCALVADDRVALAAQGGRLVARCPPAIRGLIEARGVGLLRAESLDEAEIVVVADLDAAEAGRLPPWRDAILVGIRLPRLQKSLSTPFAPAILQYLKGGRASPAMDDEP